jgi:autotransporter-associated beta strand protein
MTTHSRSKARSTLAAAFCALLAMTAVSSAQTDSTLSGLVPSAGTLAPVFDSGTTSYTATVPNTTDTISVTPTATDPTATITVNSTTVTSGTASAAFSLSVGTNVITTEVVSQDLSTTNTYTLTVTRAPNVELSGLLPSAGTLAPAFASGTISYTASVPYTTTDITVTPTAVNTLATITVNGVAVTSGSPSGSLPLSVGANTITTVVTGEDAVTTKTYTLTVTRAAPNVDLSSLVPSAGTLAPAFASGTISYSASVPTATTEITLTPTAVNSLATITVNGNTVTSGDPSGTITLNAGSNTITTVVTGEDAVTTKTYTLTVIRGPKTLFSSGTKAWDTTTANWGLVTGGPYNTAIWSNSDNGDSATLQGTAGTLTLGGPISIKNMSFTHTTGTYTITGSALNFTSGTIATVASTATGNPIVASISSNITGSPNIDIKPMDGDEQFVLNPVANGSMVIGAVTGDTGNGSERLSLQGGTGSTGTIASSTGPKVLVTSGSWRLTGASSGRNHEVSAGTLTLNANLNATNRAVILSGTGVLNYNVASAVSASAATNVSTDNGFRITGGTLDQTSGSAINTNASTTTIDLAGTLTFAGSNGASSNLHLGSGAVFLKGGNRQITVTNAAATLTLGGVIQNDSTPGRSLTKAGAGTLELRGANSYTGATAVNAGTLKMGANNVIPNASNVSIGAATLDVNTRTDTAGTLSVTGTAVINLGSGAAIAFADSKAVAWTGNSLDITGTLGATSLRFGDSADDLTATQLAKISVNGSGLGTYVLDASGYLVASGGGDVTPPTLTSITDNVSGGPSTVGTMVTYTITFNEDMDAATVTSADFENSGTAAVTIGTVTETSSGVFSVQATPTTAGSLNLRIVGPVLQDTSSNNLVVPISDDTTITVQTAYAAWAGGALFDQDANGDGVKNGLAFLLGAASPTTAVTPPSVTQSGGDLILNFNCLPDAARGSATLKVEHSSDLGALDPWTATTNEVPDATNAIPDNDVTFVVSAGPAGPPALNSVTATIGSAAAAGNKLFARLKAVETP